MTDHFSFGKMGQTPESVRAHGCGWPGCKMRVPAHLWGCRSHWFRLPELLRRAISRAYVAGQSVSTWSPEYQAAHEAVDQWIVQQAEFSRRKPSSKSPEGEPGESP